MFGVSPIVPAYGRDYKSKKALLEDFDKDLDFLTPLGQPINKSQLKEMGLSQIQARFKANRSVAMIKIA